MKNEKHFNCKIMKFFKLNKIEIKSLKFEIKLIKLNNNFINYNIIDYFAFDSFENNNKTIISNSKIMRLIKCVNKSINIQKILKELINLYFIEEETYG